METATKRENFLKPIMDSNLVDYTKMSSMSYFIEDGCKYCLSVTEEYGYDFDGLMPTGSFIVVVTGPRGTYMSKMTRKRDNVGWNSSEKGYREIVGEKVYSLIEKKLY